MEIRKLVAAALLALPLAFTGLSGSPASAMPIDTAPATLARDASSTGVEAVRWVCGPYGCGWRRHRWGYRPYWRHRYWHRPYYGYHRYGYRHHWHRPFYGHRGWHRGYGFHHGYGGFRGHRGGFHHGGHYR